MADIQSLERMATQVRRDIIRMVHACQSGHPGGSLGCADFFTALYQEIMDHNPTFNMEGKGEDVFYLSNGHISPVWYSVLARSGYFPVEELATFRALNSRLQGHPATHEGLPGIRVASGSLGQGLSIALGTALAKKMDGDDKLVYVLTGDGELQEGQIWEAMLFAAHQKTDNVIVTVDWNGQQIDGSNDDVLSLGDLEAKWLAFGWDVVHMDGNKMAEVLKGFAAAKAKTGKGKPVVILMKTDMGHGVDFMSGTHKWHGKPPNDEQKDIALAQLEETLGDYPL
ncbi:transketolase [Aureispira anguillae]|uniref:Transketolase n=1 Tax=Aureispira anguillae TaxID=2864201 RepID=A0A916DVI5_9BACT|nr:transketolase [Aureispira anguillae]BDS14406.1 transketolase [Aureispira anguillae]